MHFIDIDNTPFFQVTEYMKNMKTPIKLYICEANVVDCYRITFESVDLPESNVVDYYQVVDGFARSKCSGMLSEYI